MIGNGAVYTGFEIRQQRAHPKKVAKVGGRAGGPKAVKTFVNEVFRIFATRGKLAVFSDPGDDEGCILLVQQFPSGLVAFDQGATHQLETRCFVMLSTL